MTAPLVIARLNERWRIEDDGMLQWILAMRQGRKGVKRTGWIGKRFHRLRTPLIASIEELCGSVNPDAMAIIWALPEQYGQQHAVGERVIP
jgi:hypothetical protein